MPRLPALPTALRSALLAAALLPGVVREAPAYAYGSGICDAVADGGFMTPRRFHPGDDGGFVIRVDRPDYLPGERLRVVIEHGAATEVFSGFLLYAQDAAQQRHGLFTPVPGTTLAGMLPAACAHVGHTITHLHGASVPAVRERIALAWQAPADGQGPLELQALVLRADRELELGTDFHELRALLSQSPHGIFRSHFEAVP